MAYATAQNMIDRFDIRRLGDLLLDTKVRATEALILASTRLDECLDDGASMIDISVLAGKKYTAAELAALASTTSTKQMLERLNCDLTLGLLYEGRGHGAADIAKLAPGFVRAERILEQLRMGNLVFGDVDDAPGSQLPVRVVLSKGLTLVTGKIRLFGDLSRE